MVIRILSLCLLAITLCLPSKAELILFEQTGKGPYELVDYDASQHKSDLDKIFKEILLKYQWPMITMYFHELPEAEQMEYLVFLEKPNGVEAFVNHKLEMLYKDKYRVRFIPNTIFEMAVINNFIDFIINTKEKTVGDQKSIFHPTDLRNGLYAARFKMVLDNRFLEGLKKSSNESYGFLKAVKYAYEEFNMDNGIKEQYFQAIRFLNQHIGSTLLWNLHKEDKPIGKVIKYFIKFFQDNVSNFLKKIEEKDKIFFGIKFEYLDHAPNYLLFEDIPYLQEGISEDYQAAKNNRFILFRGSGGFSLTNEQPENQQPVDQKLGDTTSATVGRGKQVIIDNPSREIITSSNKITHPTLRKILPINPTIKDSSQQNLFTPTSLSFGNSLLAGTFWDSGEGLAARALDFIRKKPIGYGISFPIKDYIKPNNKNLRLDQKYYISPLHTIPALWASGEWFHSRSKVSLTNANDKWSGNIHIGIGAHPINSFEFLLQDQGLRTGLLIIPDVPWNKLASEIADDIAKHIIWIKGDPSQRKLLMDTQKNSSLFTALDLDALQKHFQNSQSVFPKIREGVKLKEGKRERADEKLTRTQEEKKEKSQEIASRIKTPFQNLINLNSAPDTRTYENKNPFWNILKNPKENLKTPMRFESKYSLSFDDLRKRTKQHIIVIPKGLYMSFSHFVDNATDNEIVDYCRSTAETAEKAGLDKTGYRIISNHSINPGRKTNNNANQEVPHFHTHLAGGECLGKSVEGAPLSTPNKPQTFEPINMSISKPPLGFGLSKNQVIQEALKNKIAQIFIEGQNKESLRVIAYKIDGSDDNVPLLIGFILLDEKNNSPYPSVQEFLKNARPEVLVATLKFINNIAKGTNLFETGYRLFANVGKDSWQEPKDLMQIFIAGGNTLGVTVTNSWGNFHSESSTSWDKRMIYDFDQLQQMPHNHCPVHPGDFKAFSDEALDIFHLNITTPEKFLEIKKKLPNIHHFLSKLDAHSLSTPSQNIVIKAAKEATIKMIKENLGYYSRVNSTLTEVEPLLKSKSLSVDETRLMSKKLTDIEIDFKKLEEFKNILSEISQNFISVNIITTFYDIGPKIYSPSPAKLYQWEFIELDGILTKGLYSTELTNPNFIERLNKSMKAGYKVLAITSRPYWENMDEDPTNKDHKDTFKLLHTLGLQFSNPANLAPFSLGSSGATGKLISRFKDGVIFCPHGDKGACLSDYLTVLAEKGEDFPFILNIYDTNQQNLESIGHALSKLQVPGRLNLVNVKHK